MNSQLSHYEKNFLSQIEETARLKKSVADLDVYSKSQVSDVIVLDLVTS